MSQEFINYILHSNVINFILMLIVIGFICKKINVAQKIEDIRFGIEKKVTTSDDEKKQSENELKNIETSLENLDTELENILKKADETVVGIQEIAKKEVEKTILKAEDNSKRILNLEEKKIRQDLSDEFGIEALEKAKNNLFSNLDNNADLHNKFIDESIAELDRLEI